MESFPEKPHAWLPVRSSKNDEAGFSATFSAAAKTRRRLNHGSIPSKLQFERTRKKAGLPPVGTVAVVSEVVITSTQVASVSEVLRSTL